MIAGMDPEPQPEAQPAKAATSKYELRRKCAEIKNKQDCLDNEPVCRYNKYNECEYNYPYAYDVRWYGKDAADAYAASTQEPAPEPAAGTPTAGFHTAQLLSFLEREGLHEYHDPLHELGAECLSDLADVTDAEFAECGVPQDKGEWLRGQAQAVTGKDGGALAGIPEGVPNEDGGV